MDAQSADATAAHAITALARRRSAAIKGAFFAEVIDMFDIYLPVVVLSPVLGYFQPKEIESGLATILASFVYITTLLGRPLGAVLFGVMSDRIGRRRASIWSVAGFSVITLLIGLIPGYSTLGIGSYVLLVTLRFLDGICLGGGYTGALPLALESSAKARRGLVGGFVIAGFCVAYIAINLVALAMFALFPLEGLDSPYARIGWRVPFVLGAILGGVLALYYAFNVEESAIWKEEAQTRPTRQPLANLFRGATGRGLLQVLLMMTGFWTTQNLITLYLPSVVLPRMLHMSKFEVSVTLLITYGVLFFSYIGACVFGQAVGRRRAFLILGPLIATVGSALLHTLAHGEALAFPLQVAITCALAVLVTAPWGIIVTYVNERFATEVRATGFGVGFSLSVIVPSFYAFYLAGLGKLVGEQSAPAALLLIGAVLATVGAALGPETRDVDF